MKRPVWNNYIKTLLFTGFLFSCTYILSTYSFNTLAQEEPTEPQEPTEIIDTEPPTVPTHIFPPKEPTAVINSENFYIEWEEAQDNVTLPENITYQYIPYKFGPEPILPEPFTYFGTTRHPAEGYDNDFMEGIYWYAIVAIDEAGNPSEPPGGHSMSLFVIDNTNPDKVEDLRIYEGYTSDVESILGCKAYVKDSEFRIQWQETQDNWNPLEEPPTDYNFHVDHYLLSLKATDTEPNPELPIEEPWEKKVKEIYYDMQEEELIPDQDTYEFVVTAVDLAGNKGEPSESCSLILDTDTPTTTITSPSNNEISKSPLSISGYSSDSYTVDTVSLYYTTYDSKTSLCGEEWEQLTTKEILEKESSPFNWSYYESSLEDGRYCLKAQSKDLAGNLEDLELAPITENLMYDATKPIIENITISEERKLESISIYDNLSGIQGIEMRVGSLSPWQAYSPNEDLDSLVSNEPGDYSLYIRVTDNAGNQAIGLSPFTIPEPPQPIQEPEEPVLGANTTTNNESSNNSNTETAVPTTETGSDTTTQDPEDLEEEITLGNPENPQTDSSSIPMEQSNLNTPEYQINTPQGDVKGESTENNNNILWISVITIIPLLVIFIVLLTKKDNKAEETF